MLSIASQIAYNSCLLRAYISCVFFLKYSILFLKLFHLSYIDWVIYRCTQSCGVLRERSHYHCPTCDKAIISRGDFIFHLKGHEAKQGLKPTRGRKKTLATVMGNEAGLQNIQV